MESVHVPSPKLRWLKPLPFGFKFTEPKKYSLNEVIQRPRTGVKKQRLKRHIPVHLRRSARKGKRFNYDESNYDVGDKVTVNFDDDNMCSYDYDGTIIGVHGPDFNVKFHHDNEIWMCYREGETLKAWPNGKQDTL